jgi:hypothetical protein
VKTIEESLGSTSLLIVLLWNFKSCGRVIEVFDWPEVSQILQNKLIPEAYFKLYEAVWD